MTCPCQELCLSWEGSGQDRLQPPDVTDGQALLKDFGSNCFGELTPSVCLVQKTPLVCELPQPGAGSAELSIYKRREFLYTEPAAMTDELSSKTHILKGLENDPHDPWCFSISNVYEMISPKQWKMLYARKDLA